MSLLQNENLIKQLRSRFSKLTHTSSQKLDKIKPFANCDEYGTDLGEIVCATSDDFNRDFYALRTNDRTANGRNTKINHRRSFFDSKGPYCCFFVFEELDKKALYYEYVLSSENFIPVVSKEGVEDGTGFNGEWVSPKTVDHFEVKSEKSKGDILAQTDALVFTIADGKKNDYLQRSKINGNPYVVLKELIQKGILISENPDKVLCVMNKLVDEGRLDNQTLQKMKGSLKTSGLIKRLSNGMEEGKTWLKKVFQKVASYIKGQIK